MSETLETTETESSSNHEFAKEIAKTALVAAIPYATYLAVGYGYSIYLKRKAKKNAQTEN